MISLFLFYVVVPLMNDLFKMVKSGKYQPLKEKYFKICDNKVFVFCRDLVCYSWKTGCLHEHYSAKDDLWERKHSEKNECIYIASTFTHAYIFTLHRQEG